MAQRKKRKSRRGNRTFIAPDKSVWDSEFEWHVHNGFRDLGYDVRRTDKRDTLTYHSQIKAGRCLECGSDGVVQERVYNPDLVVVEPNLPDEGLLGRSITIECKGYFPQERRSLLRQVKEQHPGVDLRFIFSKEARLTKARTNIEYVNSMIKCPAAAWNNGDFEWRFPK